MPLTFALELQGVACDLVRYLHLNLQRIQAWSSALYKFAKSCVWLVLSRPP